MFYFTHFEKKKRPDHISTRYRDLACMHKIGAEAERELRTPRHFLGSSLDLRGKGQNPGRVPVPKVLELKPE